MTSYERDLKILALKSYYNGMRDGIKHYAHWKDGLEYVGTTGRSLAEAIKAINKEEETRIEQLKATE